MKDWNEGLVIGKFRPPHLGHSFLIRTALGRSEHLTIIVCADDSDTVPAALRGSWLAELFPEATIRVEETSGYDAADSQLWADLTRDWLGKSPDVVFTSESYGEPFARCLGCAHVAVDSARVQVPISASTILARPFARRLHSHRDDPAGHGRPNRSFRGPGPDLRY